MGQDEPQELGHGRRRVVRVGDLVRIPSHRRSMYVAEVLRHLEGVGFDGAPRWLGQTDDGHDLLSYIEGTVPREPPFDLADDQLIAAADLVRRFHDSVAGTELCGGLETVCHGDLGPHNTVFRLGRPVAIIDWDDDVRPGRRAVDFADAVWGFADLTSDSVPVAEQARRIALMCSAYPPMSGRVVVTELSAQFERARRRHRLAGRHGPQAVFDGLIGWMDRHGSDLAADR